MAVLIAALLGATGGCRWQLPSIFFTSNLLATADQAFLTAVEKVTCCFVGFFLSWHGVCKLDCVDVDSTTPVVPPYRAYSCVAAVMSEMQIGGRKMTRKQISGVLLTAALACSSVTTYAIPVALELALLVDVSGSVDTNEYDLQKTGYIDAFNDSFIQNAITSLTDGIAATYIEWSGDNEQSQLVGWTQITDSTTSGAFATAISNTNRLSGNLTAPGSAIEFATPLFDDNGFESDRWTIDVSGDGDQNDGSDTAAARDAFTTFASGVADEGSIATINGLAIGSTSIESFYENNIKTPNGFVIRANNFADFDDAIRQKLRREITGTVPAPATLALIGIGLLGFSWRRVVPST